MKTKILLFICIALFPEFVISQNFTVNDIEIGRLTYLKPQDIRNIQWREGSDNISYIRNDSLFASSVYRQEELLLLSLVQLNDLLEKNELSDIKQFPDVAFLSENKVLFNVNSQMISLDMLSNDISVFTIPETNEVPVVEPHTHRIAYTDDQNIFFSEFDKDRVQLTNDSVEGIMNGETVYRHEFGMEEGMLWSPCGNYLAFYKKDESQVAQYPLVNIQGRIAFAENIRYPMAGMASEETEIWVYSVSDGSLVKLETIGEPDSYHTNLCWSPDEKLIYLQHLNRDQNRMTLCYYSSVTGEKQKELFTEIDKKYVEPMNPLVLSEKVPGDFLYQSEKSGYNHIYYFDSKKNKLVQLTKGDWEVTGLIGFDENEKSIFFMATKDSPLERHLYKYDMDSKSVTRLTSVNGTHEVVMNSNKTMFIDSYSSTSVPNIIRIIDNEGNEISEWLNAPNPLEEYSLGKVTTGTILAADNKTPLYYRITWPVDFDSTQKYPVILYVYGGPHVQLISDSWFGRTGFLHQYFAQHGIASFELDCRGSDYRGREFEDIVHRQLGIPQIEDQYKGIAFLKKQSWIDTNRIGIHGWSFGGFMTISMMLHYPDLFKIGVAGGPVTDWKLYEVMYGERYMDPPEENPEGYDKTNLNKLTGNLQGKLLIIHGALDNTVVWQNSLVFIQECINNNKQVDYFVYPLEEHNVLGKERVHLTEKIARYFLDNL